MAILIVTLTGCSDHTDGRALPANSTSAPIAKATSNTAPADVFGDLKACPVLDKALAGQGLSVAVEDKADGDNGCKSDKGQYGGLSLTLQPGLGIEDLNADPTKIHDGQINDRKATQIRDGIRSEGDCAIAIEVTKTSRVLISAALSTGTTEEACAFVYEVAQKVEPQLPKGS